MHLPFAFLALILACVLTSNAWAGKTPHRCNATGAVFQSEFFGYYPTCWRQFPPQPECCAAATAKAPIESLPQPQPAPKAAAPKDDAKPAPKAAAPKDDAKPAPKPQAPAPKN
jgi:hypothetical protein